MGYNIISQFNNIPYGTHITDAKNGTMMYKLQGSSMKSVLKRWGVRIAIPRLMANLGYHQNLGGFQLARASLSVSPRADQFIKIP